MKRIILTFGLVLTGLALFGQSPRIRLNQITKDSITGSIVLSGSDSNMVYSRNFYIGTDSSLVFYGTTIVGGGGAGGSFVTLPQLNDSLNNYVDFGSLSDSLLNYINSITLSDSLINYISKTAAFGGDVTGTYDNITVTDNSHNHSITTLTGLQDSLNGKAALVHTHTITDIVGLQDSLNSKAALIHSHAISDVAALQDSLNAKAPTVHSHTISDVANLQDSLNDKANDADLNNYLLTSNYIVDSTRINATGDTAYYYQNGVIIGTGAIAGGGGGGGGGTVTNVSAGTQISGMSMTITNPTTTPSIATAITSQSDFRTAIGAGTGNGTVTGVTAGTFLSGGTITSSGTIALDTASAGLKTYISENGGGGTVNLATGVTGTLPVANGGTGATTLTSGAFLRGNTTSAIGASSNLSETADTVFVSKFLNVDTLKANNISIGNLRNQFPNAPFADFDIFFNDTLNHLLRFWNAGGGQVKLRFIGSDNIESSHQWTTTSFWAAQIAATANSSSDATQNYMDFRVLGTTNSENGLANNTIIRARGDGRVGIGTTAPTDQLHNYRSSGSITTRTESGDIANGESTIFTASSENRLASIGVYKHSGITNNCGFLYVTAEDNEDRYIWSDNSGNLRISATITHIGTTSGTVVGAQTSDKRLKYDLGEFQYGINQVMALNPVRYTYIDDQDQKPRIGFYAQDVMSVIPESVFDTKEVIKDGESTKLGMEYVALIPVLTKAIQEQQAIIESQNQEINTLKTQIQNILTEINNLKNN